MSANRLPLLSKLRLSVSIAILALGAMVSLALAERLSLLVEKRAEIFGASLALGVVLWIAGSFTRRAQDDEESPFRFLLNPRYGAVMTPLMALLFLVAAHQRPHPRTPAPPQPAPTVAVTRAPRAFPVLKLQGIAIQSGGSQALINKRLFEVGDKIDGEVQVIAISRDQVTVALDGQTNVLWLNSPPSTGTRSVAVSTPADQP